MKKKMQNQKKNLIKLNKKEMKNLMKLKLEIKKKKNMKKKLRN